MKKIILIFSLFLSVVFSDTSQPTDCCAVNQYMDKTASSSINWDETVPNAEVSDRISQIDGVYVSTCTQEYTWQRIVDGSSTRIIQSLKTTGCVSNPICDSNQTLDTSVNPPICVNNPPACEDDEILFNNVCTECPENSSPSQDKTFCDCSAPYVPNAETAVCENPCNPDTEVPNTSTGACDTHD